MINDCKKKNVLSYTHWTTFISMYNYSGRVDAAWALHRGNNNLGLDMWKRAAGLHALYCTNAAHLLALPTVASRELYTLSGPLQASTEAALNLKGVPVNAYIAQELTAPVLTTKRSLSQLTPGEENPDNSHVCAEHVSHSKKVPQWLIKTFLLFMLM